MQPEPSVGGFYLGDRVRAPFSTNPYEEYRVVALGFDDIVAVSMTNIIRVGPSLLAKVDRQATPATTDSPVQHLGETVTRRRNKKVFRKRDVVDLGRHPNYS